MCLLNSARVKDHLHDSENWPRSPFERSKFVRSSSTLRIVLKRCVNVIGRNWIHLVTCSKIESPWPTLLQSLRARQNLWNLHFRSLSMHKGGLAKSHFWIVATQKKRIGEQLNYFWNMCPKPFSWTKNARKLFSDGKSRGPLLVRAALKRNTGQL